MVNVTHDRNHWRTRHQIFFVVFDRVDNVFHVRIRNARHFVTEFLDDQFGGVRINRLVLRRHDAVGHQRLHNVSNPFGHPVGQFADHNGFGQLNVAHNLFALNRTAHSLLTRPLLLTLHGRHGPLTPALCTRQRLVQGQFTAAPSAVIAASTVISFLAFTTCRLLLRRLATTFWCCGFFRRTRCRFLRLRCSLLCCSFSRFLRFFFFALLGFQRLFALTLFTLFGFLFGTAAFTLFCARLFLGLTFRRIISFARLGCLNSLQPAFHFGIRNACRTLGRIPRRRRCTRRWFTRTGFGHHNALALGFNHNILGPPMAEALLYIAGSGPTQTKCFFAVTIAHRALFSFLTGVAVIAIRAQTLQLSRFLYNTRGESTRGERCMYHSLSPKSETQLICCEPSNIIAPVRGAQFRFTAARPINCLDQDLCMFLIKPGFDLFVSCNCIARFACQRNQIDQPPRDQGFDLINQTFRDDHLCLGTTRKQVLVDRLGQRRTIRNDIKSTSGQFSGNIRHNRPVRPCNEPDKYRFRMHFTRCKALAFRT